MHKRRKKENKRGGGCKESGYSQNYYHRQLSEGKIPATEGLSAETRVFIFSHSLRGRRLLGIKTDHVMD